MQTINRILLLVLLLTFAACDSNEPEEPGDTRIQTIDFVLEDLQGNSFQLSSTQGSVVIVNFFSPTCPICQAEAEDMNTLYETYSNQGLEVIGVALRAQSVDEVQAFVDAYDIPFKVLMDDAVVSAAYRVAGTPDAVFIDREGFTVDRISGFKPIGLVAEIVEALL